MQKPKKASLPNFGWYTSGNRLSSKTIYVCRFTKSISLGNFLLTYISVLSFLDTDILRCRGDFVMQRIQLLIKAETGPPENASSSGESSSSCP